MRGNRRRNTPKLAAANSDRFLVRTLDQSKSELKLLHEITTPQTKVSWCQIIEIVHVVVAPLSTGTTLVELLAK